MTETQRLQDESGLHEIIELLPDEPMGTERREHHLTKQDVILIAKLIDLKMKSIPCPIDLTKAQEVTLKAWLNAWATGVSITSILLLTAIVSGAIVVFTKGFWVMLFEGVKR